MQTVLDAVIAWLNGSTTTPLARPVERGTALIEQGILDSIEILNLVSFLEEKFHIALPIDDFVPENFQSPEAIATLVARLSSTTLTA